MHGDKHFRRILHLAEPLSGHLENGQFRRRPKAVFYASEHPVRPTVFPFELKDNVHYMFKYLGAGNGAFFGNMANQDYGNSGAFCKAEQRRGNFLYLAYASCGRIHGRAVHGLDGIHDEKVRGHLIRLFQDGGHVRFAVYEAVGGIPSKAVRPHLHLLHAFLSGDVQGLELRPAEGQLQ